MECEKMFDTFRWLDKPYKEEKEGKMKATKKVAKKAKKLVTLSDFQEVVCEVLLKHAECQGVRFDKEIRKEIQKVKEVKSLEKLSDCIQNLYVDLPVKFFDALDKAIYGGN